MGLKPEGITATGSPEEAMCRIGGLALRYCKQGNFWAQRVEPQLYRVGPTAAMTEALGGSIDFVDFVDAGTTMIVGRPFGMAEGPTGVQLELVSIFDGEVVSTNDALKDQPQMTNGVETRPSQSWIIEIDSFIGDEDDEALW